MITIGIDVGSRTSKIVFYDNSNREIIGSDVVNTGVNPRKTAQTLFDENSKKLNIKKDAVKKIFATGYGRHITTFADRQISEITCQAKGVHFLFPNAKTIIDIGGQDSKGISLNDKGNVIDFVMNDKCAAGTGRFLEVVSNILQITIEDLTGFYNDMTEELIINNVCVVFAESEIIGLIATGTSIPNIVYAVHQSIAVRTASMMHKIPIIEPVIFTGGVAQNLAMKLALEKTLGVPIIIPDTPSITAALGAAIVAGLY